MPCEQLPPLDRLRAILEMFQQAADELLVAEFGDGVTLAERMAHEFYNGVLALYAAALESFHAASVAPLDELTDVMAEWVRGRPDPVTGGTVGDSAPLPDKAFDQARN